MSELRLEVVTDAFASELRDETAAFAASLMRLPALKRKDKVLQKVRG